MKMDKSSCCQEKISRLKAVILAENRDFGKCKLTSQIPMALWPILEKTTLENLLQDLSSQGVKEAVICSNGDTELLKKHVGQTAALGICFLERSLPAGTAGCLRDAIKDGEEKLLLVLKAETVLLPDIDALLSDHLASRADMTIISMYRGDGNNIKEDIYICNSDITSFIPEQGYFDIKEELIPAITRVGKTVRSRTLYDSITDFEDHQEYISAISTYLTRGDIDGSSRLSGENNLDIVHVASTAKIDEDVSVLGHVVIMDRAYISSGTVISGPAVIGRNVKIGKNTLIENSVLWDGSSIGKNCEVRKSVIGYGAVVPNRTVIENKSVLYSDKVKLYFNTINSLLVIQAKRFVGIIRALFYSFIFKVICCLRTNLAKPAIIYGIGVIIIIAAFYLSFWPELTGLFKVWLRSDEYSSGLLVPFLALYILWAKRENIDKASIQPSLWGLCFFVLAQAIRYFGLFFMYSSLERCSLVLSIASLVLLLFGWQIFRKVLAVLLFMFLMLPLPNSIDNVVTLPLQSLATASAVFCLETFGYAAIRDGNIIYIGDIAIAVSDACNGLRMVTAFVIITGFVALLVRRQWWEKTILLASSLPIALLCNTIRLSITAVAFTILSGEKWAGLFHDIGGYLMMPLALAIVVCELWILRRLTIVHEELN